MTASADGEALDLRGLAFTRLETEQSNPATAEIDRMTPLEIVQAMNAEDAGVAAAVARELPQVARAIEAIAGRLRGGGRLIYMGAGTSGRLGVLDAVECPPTFNVPPDLVVGRVAGGSFALTTAAEDSEDSADAGETDVRELAVGAGDAVVGIAASGRTPYVLSAVAYAKQQGALTIGLACNADTPLAGLADISIAPVVGPEVVTGSTRLKAGTAQKMVLNMLSTGTMVLLGKTFGNLMVDVRATNAKLRRRAVEIVSRVTARDTMAAAELLHTCGDEVKTAIVVGRMDVTPARARELLTVSGGVLRAALDGLDGRR